jgi:hypothetical protein
MGDKPEHLKWLVDTGERLTTADEKTVEVWEFRHQPDEAVLSAWAKHFRNHYCSDDQIDELIENTEFKTHADYLVKIKFPDEKKSPGPSIRAGDFGEILIADFLEYILGFHVPRTRYIDRTVRNESTKGCDIIGFRFVEDGKWSRGDALAIFEVKAQFSGTKPSPRLQDAVDGSINDLNRRAESLNAIRQRFLDVNDKEAAKRVNRFQNPPDNPYKELYGAAALFAIDLFDCASIATTIVSGHPRNDRLKLIVVRGVAMMDLVHKLYQRAANEA